MKAMTVKEFAIVVTTCDAYQDVMNYFFPILEKYWPNNKYNIYVISEKNSDYNCDGKVNIINTDSSLTWAKRFLTGLGKITEKYVLFMMDDYYIGKNIDIDYINYILDYINDNDITYYDLRNKNSSSKVLVKGKIGLIKTTKNYAISLQAAIWNKERLEAMIQNCDCSAWQIEEYFNSYCNEIGSDYVPNAVCDLTNPLNIQNAVIKGKWVPSVVRFFKKRGILINTKSRKFLSKKERIRQSVFTFFSNILPKMLRVKLKKFLKKIGFKFVTK